MKLKEFLDVGRPTLGRGSLESQLSENTYKLTFSERFGATWQVDKYTGNLYCDNNKLTSLEGCPKSITGTFSCSKNNLITLEGAPQKVGGGFYCVNNKLTSLKGVPTLVEGDFNCGDNKLVSLEGIASEIAGDLDCCDNLLTSLEGIHKHIKHIGGHAYFQNNPIKSHVLGLLRISGLQGVILGSRDVERIINKYLKGDRDILACQEELIAAGREDFAQL